MKNTEVKNRDLLVVQWLDICLSLQGMQVQFPDLGEGILESSKQLSCVPGKATEARMLRVCALQQEKRLQQKPVNHN